MFRVCCIFSQNYLLPLFFNFYRLCVCIRHWSFGAGHNYLERQQHWQTGMSQNSDFLFSFSALVLHYIYSIFIFFFICVQTQPLFELRCSNNVVHVHTCADSCAALVNMLQYLVCQGDLHPPPRHTCPTEIAGQKLPVRMSVDVFNVPHQFLVPPAIKPCPSTKKNRIWCD